MKDLILEIGVYQDSAARTMRKDLDREDQILNMALGLGELGEIQNKIKKAIYHGHGFTAEMKAKIREEIGDGLWYLAGLATALDWELYEIATENIRKLKERYPDGFSAERSINRKE